jgi:hypothetical protein
VPTPADLRKQFIKTFESLAHQRERHDVLADFLDMAVCAIRKKTLPPGQAADALEAQYMAVVKRNTPDDVRKMPTLLGITALAVQEGEIIAEQGFVTVQEPACGAGGMIIAAADVLTRKGFDIGTQLYVEATDISPMCFRMSYLQASLRGIPATIRRGNTLSLEMFEHARTPAFFGFYAAHQEAFDAWHSGEGRGGVSYDAEITQRGAAAESEPPHDQPQPIVPAARERRTKAVPRQFTLFD